MLLNKLFQFIALKSFLYSLLSSLNNKSKFEYFSFLKRKKTLLEYSLIQMIIILISKIDNKNSYFILNLNVNKRNLEIFLGSYEELEK
jgi:hypothetical protein